MLCAIRAILLLCSLTPGFVLYASIDLLLFAFYFRTILSNKSCFTYLFSSFFSRNFNSRTYT